MRRALSFFQIGDDCRYRLKPGVAVAPMFPTMFFGRSRTNAGMTDHRIHCWAAMPVYWGDRPPAANDNANDLELLDRKSRQMQAAITLALDYDEPAGSTLAILMALAAMRVDIGGDADSDAVFVDEMADILKACVAAHRTGAA